MLATLQYTARLWCESCCCFELELLFSAMFVQEEKIFAGNVLKIHICTMEGTEWLEEVTEDTTIEKLKEKCLKHVSIHELTTD